ncbi:50S ribosomal protein L3 [Candidatus Regiella endosymbiont of Tuberolachnus salignus]|uniref:50S ribosomal protein L3 n=1 Tax=Candidatus Regiella endosymbiont of Tuberolachnus salignus TaxID=3077956 RepID=UPI003BB1E4BE
MTSKNEMGLIGKKLGMTRIFTEEGVSIPVTVIEIEANRVTEVKTLDTDGYSAIQVTTGTKKIRCKDIRKNKKEEVEVKVFNRHAINKASAGHFLGTKTTREQKPDRDNPEKINIEKKILQNKTPVMAGRGLWEFRIAEAQKFSRGEEITVEIFADVKKVDVTGTSKGKGFAGVVKRWNFRTQDATHGNSLSHRAPGSIGQNQTPGKVFKGKKMAGHLGDERVTVQSLDVVRVDAERNLLLVKGAVPGATGGNLIVKPAVKA